MELFRIKKDIPFMSYGRLTTAISLVTFILAIFFLAHRGLNFGVDFTGGTVMEVNYPQSANLERVREAVDSIGLYRLRIQFTDGTVFSLNRVSGTNQFAKIGHCVLFLQNHRYNRARRHVGFQVVVEPALIVNSVELPRPLRG